MRHVEARAPLTVLAERYEVIKREGASGLRARQLASRSGNNSAYFVLSCCGGRGHPSRLKTG